MLIIGLYDFYRVKRLPICFESDDYTDKYPWYFTNLEQQIPSIIK